MSRHWSTQKAIGQALLDAHRHHATLDPRSRAEYQRMVICHANQSVPPSTHQNSRERGSTSHQRCKSRLCAPCVEEHRSIAASNIQAAFELGVEQNQASSFIVMSIAGPDYPFQDAAKCVASAMTSWKRFATAKLGKAAIAGYARGLELRIAPSLASVSVHTRLIALINTERYILDHGGWEAVWNTKAVGGHYRLAELHRHSVDCVAQFAVHSAAREVATVAVRPETLCEVTTQGVRCCPDKLGIVRAALKGRRLICFGGIMR
jgi:hypothetical protein